MAYHKRQNGVNRLGCGQSLEAEWGGVKGLTSQKGPGCGQNLSDLAAKRVLGFG